MRYGIVVDTLKPIMVNGDPYEAEVTEEIEL